MACQKTPLIFVDSVREIFAPLLRGIPTVIVPDAVLVDPTRLVKTLADADVTRISLVPSLLRMLLEGPEDLQDRVPRLRHWVTSGEPLSTDLVERFRQRLPRSILINRYGATEGISDLVRCHQSPCRHRVPIGLPFDNVSIHLLDEHMQPVSAGSAGEIYLGGEDVARGYLGHPELTAERFLPDPFARDAGSRLYRTGDLGRRRPDGEIEYLGRTDQQLQLRGTRVEIGEIEAALRQHPQVRDAAVATGETASGEPMLVASIVARTEPSPAARDLRRFLLGRLPPHVVPHAFVALDALPLTPTGKVDRRALSTSAPATWRPPTAYVAPRTPLEELLAELWAGLLGLDRIGIDEALCDLGGDSLLAARAVARAGDALGMELPVQAVVAASTVADQALAIVEDACRRLGPATATQLLDRAATPEGDLPPRTECSPPETGGS